MLYLLTGSIPIEFTIPRRRLVYLHHILNRDENSLLRTFFEHQVKTRKSKDWASQVLQDLNQFDIKLTMDEIRSMPEATWKQHIRDKSISISLESLNSNQGSKSRQYSELKMASYLCPNEEFMNVNTACFIAKTQTFMIENVKCNFKEKYRPNLICNSCMTSECNQEHLLYCKELIGSNELVSYIPDYIDIFDDDNCKEQSYIASLLMKNLQKKKIIESIV